MCSLTYGALRPTANLELKVCTLHQNRYWNVHEYFYICQNTNCKVLPYVFPSLIFLGSKLYSEFYHQTPSIYFHILNTKAINLNTSTGTVITKGCGISEEGNSGAEEIYFSAILSNVNTIFWHRYKWLLPNSFSLLWSLCPKAHILFILAFYTM